MTAVILPPPGADRGAAAQDDGGLLPHGRWLPRRTRCAPPPRS